jgi:hypothetical protein
MYQKTLAFFQGLRAESQIKKFTAHGQNKMKWQKDKVLRRSRRLRVPRFQGSCQAPQVTSRVSFPGGPAPA